MKSLEQLARIATPACCAMEVSRQEKSGMVPWSPARHLLLIDRMMMANLRERQRSQSQKVLIIEAPPRHGKSEYTSAYLPSWFLGRYPDRRVILTSYGDSLARGFGRKCRDLLERFGGWFGLHGIRDDVSGASDWELRNYRGGMRTAGVGGPLTGHGADLLIVDDPVKNAEEAISQSVRDAQWEWFLSTAFTRLEPTGLCVVMMTRWHEDDLIGRLVKLSEDPQAEEVQPFEVERVRLPAVAEPTLAALDPLGRAKGEPLWPERWPLASLLAKKRVLGEYWYNSLYQQRPGQYGKSAWPAEYFDEPFWCDRLPEAFEWSAIAVDPAKGTDNGDYSAIVFVGYANGLLWVDSDIERVATTPLCRKLVSMYRRRGASRVGVEGNAFQFLLSAPIAEAEREAGIVPMPVSMINNTVPKPIRIQRLGPYLDRHAFRFLRTPSNQLLVRQIKEFPQADHDDGPDALEMAVRLLDHVVRNALAV